MSGMFTSRNLSWALLTVAHEKQHESECVLFVESLSRVLIPLGVVSKKRQTYHARPGSKPRRQAGLVREFWLGADVCGLKMGPGNRVLAIPTFERQITPASRSFWTSAVTPLMPFSE